MPSTVAALCLPFVTQIWQIYLLIFILQAASAGFTPTFQATIPDILPDEEEYTKALSLSLPTGPLQETGTTQRRGTKITFRPDAQVFETIEFSNKTTLTINGLAGGQDDLARAGPRAARPGAAAGPGAVSAGPRPVTA